MQADLDKYKLTVIALSKDTVDEAAIHKERDQLKMTLLSDEKLKVIKQYGLEHHKAFGFNTGRFKMFGIPLALRPSFKAMAIPTSLIIDEKGVIKWIDQTDDYRLRSSEERILEAVKAVFK